MRRIEQIMLMGLLAAPLLLSGCDQGRSLTWTEDVRLPDGRMVTLTRHQDFMGPYELLHPPTPSDYWFEFINPDTGQTVRWESTQDLVTWSLSLNGKVPELLTAPAPNARFKYGCPDPPYLAFQFVNSKWTPVPMSQIERKRAPLNMSHFAGDVEPLLPSRRFHLSVAGVQDALAAEHKHKVIDLTPPVDQSFGTHCFPPFNWMLRTAPGP